MAEDLKKFEERKQDHIRLALDAKTQGLASTHFDRIGLTHQAFPEINFSDVTLETKLLKNIFSSPHFVSSMTAGHARSFELNQRLAKAAGEKQWLMGVGSQKRELFDVQASQEWKKIRKQNQKTKFVSNIGLEEVIHLPTDKILKIVDSVEAVGLYIHANPLQEVFQKNSEINFKNGLKSVKKLVQKSPVPVLVKEVGFGISSELMKQLFDIGVEVVDVSGRGGTHWGVLEALRESDKSIKFLAAEAFKDWGFSTVECLLKNKQIVKKNAVWASGGIRSGVESAKCLALGAKAVGVAQPLMKAAVSGDENDVLSVMERFDFELRLAMFCVGVVNCNQLNKKKVWYEQQTF